MLFLCFSNFVYIWLAEARGGGQSAGVHCSFLTPPLLLPQFPVKEQLYLSRMHSQLFRPRTQWKDSAAVKINSFPVGGGIVWLCLGTSCTLLSESTGIGHAMGREETSLASALGSLFLLTLRIVTLQIAGPVGFPFMEIFCVPAGSVADVQLFLLFIFFFPNSFSSLTA